MIKPEDCGIYMICNTVNGKVYIGRSCGIRRRWWNHRHALRTDCHTNPHLRRAWAKYGEQAFEFVLLECCPEDALVLREQHYVQQYGALDRQKGYNIVEETQEHRRASPETRERLSAALKGHPVSDATRAAQAEAARQRAPVSVEVRAKMSKSARAKAPPSQETRDRLSKAMKDRVFSEEHRAKIAAKATGRHHSQATRALISEVQRGKTITAEVRVKIAEALKGRPRSAETRAKISATKQLRLSHAICRIDQTEVTL